MSVQNDHSDVPRWLKDIESNSWQIEILISGGLMYTLYNLPEWINLYFSKAYVTASYSTANLIVFLLAILVSKALLIGFGVNLFLRAIWLAYLGVHYAYPRGIDYHRLNYSDEFQKKYEKKPSTLSKILFLENWASLSYSLSIILSMISAGVMVFLLLLYSFIIDPIFPDTAESDIIGYCLFAFFILISLGLLDRLIYPLLRNSQTATSYYSAFSNLFSYLNLSFIFKKEWLTIVSNNSRWVVHVIAVSYFMFAMIFTIYEVDVIELSKPSNLLDDRKFTEVPAYRYVMDNDEYDDQLNEYQIIEKASIPSEIIDGKLLSVFITYDQFYDRIIQYYSDSLNVVDDYYKIPQDSIGFYLRYNREAFQVILNKVFDVRLNEVSQDSLDWLYRSHPITGQEGWHTKLDIANLEVGKHELEIRREDIGAGGKGIFLVRWIPFWKE